MNFIFGVTTLLVWLYGLLSIQETHPRVAFGLVALYGLIVAFWAIQAKRKGKGN